MQKKYSLLLLILLLFSNVNADEYLVLSGQVSACQLSFSEGDVINIPWEDKSEKKCSDNDYKVEKRSTVICPFSEDGECETFDIGETLVRGRFKKAEDSTKGLFAVVDTIFNPPTDNNYGGKNLKDTDYLAGFPYGTILKPSTVLVLNSLSEQPIPIDKFELFQTDGQRLASQVKNKLIYINSSVLDYEQEYQWRLISKGKTYVGSFDVAYEEDQQALEQEIAQWLKKQPMDNAGELVIKAAVAKSYGYTFDYQQALASAKVILVK